MVLHRPVELAAHREQLPGPHFADAGASRACGAPQMDCCRRVRRHRDLRSEGETAELDRPMHDAHRRHSDAVVVWKFDRFARSVSHLLRLETFKTQGIEFISFSEQLDTSTPAGKLVFPVIGAMAELERSLIVERVRAGMRKARAKGKQIGRPPLTHLDCDMRHSIYEAHEAGGTTLRQLAVRFSTSVGSIQRSIRAYEGCRIGAAKYGFFNAEFLASFL
jgi:DNA invertase Pin-like site-specific DNA recombinase